MAEAFSLRAARLLHKSYKTCISPLFGNVCRFEPHCSDYALEAVERHGILKGSWLSFRRVLRCNPYCTGGLDPVPHNDLINETSLTDGR